MKYYQIDIETTAEGIEIVIEKLMTADIEKKFDASYLKRELNVGFSGGEKKKSEIIQMTIFRT